MKRGFIPPQTTQETVFCKKAEELILKAKNYSIKSFTSFLNLREKELITAVFNKYQGVKIDFSYGYLGDGQRCIGVIYKENDEVYDYEYQIDIISCDLIKEHNLTHRDFLGSLMSLMIKREYIGDILVFSDKVYIALHQNFTQIILDELKQIKNINVEFEVYLGELFYKESFTQTRTATVASLRLDSVLSAILKQSRSSIQTLLKQGLVTVNQMVVKSADFKMYDLDVISIKKHGKYKILTENNKSKKDRIFIDIKKY